MESIRVCNLRCLADSTTIELKPITLLVGANSSGKSSFLRLFPLLKQSHEIRTLGGLVLNEGDVNFGFFNEAVYRDADPQELTIEFGFTLKEGLFQGAIVNKFLTGTQDINCALTYAKRTKDQRYPRLKGVLFHLAGPDGPPDEIEFLVDEDGKIAQFKVNDFDGTDQVANLRVQVGRGIVPILVLTVSLEESANPSFDERAPAKHPFDERLYKESYWLFHGNTSVETCLATLHSIPIGPPGTMLEFMKNNGPQSWKDQVHYWTISTDRFHKLRNLLLAGRVNDLLGSANAYATQLAASINYFQPVRSSVDRDYLTRDVSVTAVDPSGLNVALVLSSLSPGAQRKFREWMREHFDFEVFPQSVGDGARIALRMKDAISGTEFNLADTGFGFSQMLPFLVQIWSILAVDETRPRSFRLARFGRPAIPTNHLLAIEQPELHLHPLLQARLADMIVATANLSKERGVPVRFMLETHSPTIIERIGQAIEDKKLQPDDAQVVLFELDRNNPKANRAIVKTTKFDSDGILQEWPFGFLAAPVSKVNG
jgi:AAA ATPase domain